MAAEISTSNNPIHTLTLLGRAPGWPHSDMTVLMDNNIAQHNMGVQPVDEGVFEFYGIVHNAGHSTRDMEINYRAVGAVPENIEGIGVEVIGGKNPSHCFENTILLTEMQPQENRWIKLTLKMNKSQSGIPFIIDLTEAIPLVDCNGPLIANGFAITFQPTPIDKLIEENIKLHGQNFLRLHAAYKTRGAEAEGKSALDNWTRSKMDASHYIKFMQARLQPLEQIFNRLLTYENNQQDPFKIQEGLKGLGTAIYEEDLSKITASHVALLNRMDAFLTMLQKKEGDTADILQTLQWQQMIFDEKEELKKDANSPAILKALEGFINDYQTSKVGNKDYPAFMRKLLPHVQALTIKEFSINKATAQIETNLDNPRKLQRAHSDFLRLLRQHLK